MDNDQLDQLPVPRQLGHRGVDVADSFEIDRLPDPISNPGGKPLHDPVNGPDGEIDVTGLLARMSQEALMIVVGEDAPGRRDFRCRWANAALANLLGVPDGTLTGRSFLELLPDGGQLYDLLIRAESTGVIAVGEADVQPRVAPVTRIGYRIVPENGVLGVSLSDQSPLREAEAREQWLQQLLVGGTKLSAVAAGILRPVLNGDDVIDLEFEYVNELGGRLLGVEADQVPGRMASSFASEEIPFRTFANAMGSIWRSGSPNVIEIPGFMSTDSNDFYRCHVIPLDSKIILHVDDISAKQVAKQALKASEHRYRSLFETANEGIALFDIGGRLLVANDAYAAMLGTTPNELLGLSSLSMLAPEERERTLADARGALVGGNAVQRRQIRLKRPDGSEFWAFVAATVTRDTSGNIDGFLIMALDIDEQFRSSAALAASESRYRAIVEHADMLLALTDRFGDVIFANDRLLTTLGATSEQVIGHPANQFHVGIQQNMAREDFRTLPRWTCLLRAQPDHADRERRASGSGRRLSGRRARQGRRL